MKTVLAVIALLMVSALAHSDSNSPQRIETKNAILSFRSGSADLIGVQWKQPKLDLIGEPALGENFRILLPKADFAANYFNSRDQQLSRFERTPDGVVLHYAALRNERETADVKVTYEIRDTGAQLQFSIQVTNATDRPVAEVLYGVLGGMQGIGERRDMRTLVPGGYDNLAPSLFGQYKAAAAVGQLGLNGFAYPGAMSMGWMAAYNKKLGLGYYYANQDPDTRSGMLYVETRPYTKPASTRGSRSNAAESPPGEPFGLMQGWINFPYTTRGTFRAGPVALQVHEGDWRASARLYRAWFDKHFELARLPGWLRREMAWQTLALMTPKDAVLHRFKDLPQLAADAKLYGATTLELQAWNKPSKDRGASDFEPDPRLGTAAELKQALAELRAMGMHPLLAARMGAVDTSTDDFKNRLSKYAVQARTPDRNSAAPGDATMGSRLMSPGSTGRSSKQGVALLSASHPEFRQDLIRQYSQALEYGAEALQLDTSEWNGSLDFNPAAPTSPDKSMPQGILTTYREYLQLARKTHPDAALGADLRSFDRAFPFVDVWRSGELGKDASSTALKYTFPEWVQTLSIAPGDMVSLSNGLRYGMVWVASEQFLSSRNEPQYQPAVRYLAELVRIRKQYSHLLFHGRLQDEQGAEIIGDSSYIRYSVFAAVQGDGPQRACVVVNFADEEKRAIVSLDRMQGRPATITTAFEPDRTAALPAKIRVPPGQAVVVVTR